MSNSVLNARSRRVRSPWVDRPDGLDFASERAQVAQELSSSLRGVSSEYVQQAQALLALQRMQKFCAFDLAQNVESAAGEASLPELAAIMRELAQQQSSGAAALA